MKSMVRWIVAAGLLPVCVLQAAEPTADDILRQTGISAGLAVVVGTTDGTLEADLTNGGKMLVQGLALSDEAAATSKVDKKDYPMAFVLQYGNGRTFCCVLGHDEKAFEAQGVKDLLRRGTAWAARLPVRAAGESLP